MTMMMMMMMTMAMTLTWLNLQLTQWDFPFAQQLRKPPCQNKIKIQYDDKDDDYVMLRMVSVPMPMYQVSSVGGDHDEGEEPPKGGDHPGREGTENLTLFKRLES